MFRRPHLLRFILLVNMDEDAVLGIRYLFSHCSVVLLLLGIIILLNMDESAVLGIRYLFSQRSVVVPLLRDIQFVNVLLGIRYSLSHHAPAPWLLQSYQWCCHCCIRYQVFFSHIMLLFHCALTPIDTDMNYSDLYIHMNTYKQMFLYLSTYKHT